MYIYIYTWLYTCGMLNRIGGWWSSTKRHVHQRLGLASYAPRANMYYHTEWPLVHFHFCYLSSSCGSVWLGHTRPFSLAELERWRWRERERRERGREGERDGGREGGRIWPFVNNHLPLNWVEYPSRFMMQNASFYWKPANNVNKQNKKDKKATQKKPTHVFFLCVCFS